MLSVTIQNYSTTEIQYLEGFFREVEKITELITIRDVVIRRADVI